ncbi:MAG: hypothetical protein PHV82_13285, partial [Victivallaceae bacterium]|nr:hypothetical protein [Victivallaceae bacterium]
MSFEADGAGVETSSAVTALETDSGTFKYDFPEKHLNWEIRVTDNGNERLIESVIINYGKHGVKLGKVFLLDVAVSGFSRKGDGLVVLPWDNCCAQRIYKIDDPKMPELAKVKAQFSNNIRQLALQAAFLTFQKCNTEVIIKRSRDGLAGLRAVCDFAGWELPPGCSATTEVFRILAGNDPFAQLENWADTVSARIKPSVWQDVPLGYLGWSWTDTVNGTENYEKVTFENLDAINKRLRGFGFKYLWTSMDNFKGSIPGNWLKWNYDHIPCGRKRFIETVREKGFIPGFWIGPFYFCSMVTELMKEFEDAILKTSEGEKLIVCEEWRHGDAGKIPKSERPCLYALDLSHPKIREFISKVFRTYREWGIRYYMLDFLESGAGNLSRFPYGDYFDRSLVPGAEVYTESLKIIKQCAGNDTYLLSSTGPNVHNAGIVDGVRVGNDFGEGRAISPESFFYPASYVINNPDFWTGPKRALIGQAGSYHTHGKLYLNDSGNVLTVDQPIPLSHARINATIHAFSGGPTMLGDDIRRISSERLALIKKTVPRSRPGAFPLDLFTSPSPDYPKLFLRTINLSWGEYKVLALYNFDTVPRNIIVPFAGMGLEKGRNYLVWDFWNEKFLGKKNDSFEIPVSPESVTVLRF